VDVETAASAVRRVDVVIVNINTWADTIECLESLFRSEGAELSVIVVDNGSEDGSLEYIKGWAEGRLDALVPAANPLRSLSFPPLPKPIRYAEYEREDAERGGSPEQPTSLVLIRNGANLGFTGGTNVGLRYSLARGDAEHVWLLNPDTVVRPDALRRMVETITEDSAYGLCGSTVLYYSAPGTVQVLGGAGFNKWLALPRHIGARQSAEHPVDAAQVVSSMSYVYGASMLVSRRFLLDVGLMNEELFLYLDELDWVLRARGRYRLAYSPESVVYHREGASGGSGKAKNWTVDYYFMRNRIRITREYTPIALPTVYVALLVAAVRRALRGQWDRIPMIGKLLWTESFRRGPA
jgi:GT2 family glycosyltransferase